MIRVRASYGLQNIVVFRLVGYSIWIGEVAGSSPVYYTKLFGSATDSMSDFDSEDIGSSPIRTSKVVYPALAAGMVKRYSVKVENRVRYP